MRPVTDFLPRLLPHLPGCVESVASQALVDSAIDFCNTSMVLRERLPESVTVAGEAVYDPSSLPFHRVSRITKVWVDEGELSPVVAQMVGVTPSTLQKPRSFYITREGADVLINLLPVPDAEYSLQVEVVLRPSRDATQLDDGLFDIWMEPIVEGAKARLMAIPDQPFSNPAGARLAAQLAFTLTQKARVDGSYGRVLGGIRVSPYRFY